jgi:3-oxoadipate enol-lactonase
MFYTDTGPKDRPAIIFLHAFPFSSEMWTSQVRELESDFRVITCDMRGFGKTELGDGQYLLDHLVDDLFGLMDQLKLSEVILCGLSMGGYVALRAVEREKGRVSALILADTRSEADSNEAKTKRADAISKIKRGELSAYFDGFLQGALGEDTRKIQPALVLSIKSQLMQVSPKSLVAALIALAARTDTTQFLSEISIPTLIIVGEQDTLTPPPASESMGKKISGSVLRKLPGVGHLSNLESPNEFNSELSSFLRRHFKPTPNPRS